MRPVAKRMRKAGTGAAAFRRGSSGWHAVTWAVLLAFTIQCFVTQTHIHWASQAHAGIASAKILESVSGSHKAPFENSAACPFCQVIVQAGAFFASSPPLLNLPVTSAEYTIPGLIAIAIRAPSAHSWQSRAPPQL
jgi:hypothetical protein